MNRLSVYALLSFDDKSLLSQDSAVSDIVTAIKSVAKNRPFLSPALSALLLNRRRRTAELENEKPGLHLLTPTEKRVLKLVAENKTSKEIGEELFVSYRTVESHCASCRSERPTVSHSAGRNERNF